MCVSVCVCVEVVRVVLSAYMYVEYFVLWQLCVFVILYFMCLYVCVCMHITALNCLHTYMNICMIQLCSIALRSRCGAVLAILSAIVVVFCTFVVFAFASPVLMTLNAVTSTGTWVFAFCLVGVGKKAKAKIWPKNYKNKSRNRKATKLNVCMQGQSKVGNYF